MTFKKGDVYIIAETSRNDQLDDKFGKRPCLWVGAGNQLTKVASFSNEDKARLFVKWMEYFLKEQEPVEPIYKDVMPFCGNCKHAIAKTVNYCPKCGKAVKWE